MSKQTERRTDGLTERRTEAITIFLGFLLNKNLGILTKAADSNYPLPPTDSTLEQYLDEHTLTKRMGIAFIHH